MKDRGLEMDSLEDRGHAQLNSPSAVGKERDGAARDHMARLVTTCPPGRGLGFRAVPHAPWEDQECFSGRNDQAGEREHPNKPRRPHYVQLPGKDSSTGIPSPREPVQLCSDLG